VQDLATTKGREKLPQVEGLRVRPPMTDVAQLPPSRFRTWEEGFHNDVDLAEYDRIMELARSDPQRAGRDYQRLAAGDLGASELQEFSRRPGRRMDIGPGNEVTIEGRDHGFGKGKLNQLWLDLMDLKQIKLTVPRLSEEARTQLGRLGGQAEEVLHEEVMIFVQQTGAAAGRRMTPAQHYGAFIDQLPHLDKVAAGLRGAVSAAGADDALDGALRALGKYGERLAESAANLLRGRAPGVSAKEFEALATRCRALKGEAEQGGVLTALGLADEAKDLRLTAVKLLDDVEELTGSTRRTLQDIADLAGDGADMTAVQQAIRHEFLVNQVAATARGAVRMLEEQVKLAAHEEARASASP
jgi:hypothetical protein